MLILSVFSSLFCIIHCSKKRLKINNTSYGAMGKIFIISFTDIKKSEGLHFLKVFYHREIMGWISCFPEITETSSVHFS